MDIASIPFFRRARPGGGRAAGERKRPAGGIRQGGGWGRGADRTRRGRGGAQFSLWISSMARSMW